MMIRISAFRALSIITALVLTLSGCASFGFAGASRAYEAEATAYAIAGDAVNSVQRSMTIAQLQRFAAIQVEVQAADDAMYDAMASWRDTGKKPANFEAVRDALREAQGKMHELRAEVKP